MKRRFTLGGAIVGIMIGLGIMVTAYVRVPGFPGLFELLVFRNSRSFTMFHLLQDFVDLLGPYKRFGIGIV